MEFTHSSLNSKKVVYFESKNHNIIKSLCLLCYTMAGSTQKLRNEIVSQLNERFNQLLKNPGNHDVKSSLEDIADDTPFRLFFLYLSFNQCSVYTHNLQL